MEGNVLLDNISIHEYKPKELAKKLALLPQGPIAPEGMTVSEPNVDFLCQLVI